MGIGYNYSGGIKFGLPTNSDIGGIIYSGYYNAIDFKVNNANRMRIDSSGRLLLGTTSSGSYSAKMRVIGRIEATSLAVTSNSTIFYQGGNYGSPSIAVHGYTSSTTANQKLMAFRNLSSSEKGSIKIQGNATTYNTSSDERLKENIQDAVDAGDKIDGIQIRQFDWIDGGEHQDYGVIAQELLTVAPEAVSEGYDEDEMMSVDYSKLVPTLIKEVQSLRARVAELEDK